MGLFAGTVTVSVPAIILASSVSGEPQEEEEEVNKVEVQREGSDNCQR